MCRAVIDCEILTHTDAAGAAVVELTFIIIIIIIVFYAKHYTTAAAAAAAGLISPAGRYRLEPPPGRVLFERQ